MNCSKGKRQKWEENQEHLEKVTKEAEVMNNADHSRAARPLELSRARGALIRSTRQTMRSEGVNSQQAEAACVD